MEMDRTQELEEEVRRLSRTVDEMRGRMARLEVAAPADENGTVRRSRRGFLRMGAAAAAGALGWVAVKAVPAAAATGQYMVLGSGNSAANPTTLQGTAAISPTLAVEDVNFSPTLLSGVLGATDTFSAALQGLGGQTGSVEGIDAWAGGQGANSASVYAIYGLTDGGTGVTGESITGIGLYSRGTGRIRQDPQGTPGAPSYGPNPMEQVRDSDGVLWIHNASGTWRRVNTLRTDKSDGSGAPFKPVRIADTRNGTGGVTGPVANGQVKTFNVITLSGGTIPADAIAVTGNITATGWNLNGFLTIFPAGVLYNPNADPSTMNFSGTAYAWANSFVVGLGTGGNAGQVSVYTGTFGNGHTNFIIDITGYIQ